MKSLRVISFLSMLFLLSCATEEGRRKDISPDMFSNLKIEQDERLKENAILDVAADDVVKEGADTMMTYRVKTRGITDQKSSGRCWYFSTMNILRSEVIQKYDLGEFQFSQTFGQFWDLLEKCNMFFENVIEFRSEPIDSRMNTWLFNKPFGDGGHFTNAAHITVKYGVVPQEIMPEVYSSYHSLHLMKVLRTLSRNYGLKLRSASEEDIPGIKQKALEDAYIILCKTLGTPPAEFEWTLKDKDGKVISKEKYTPASFRDKFVRTDLHKDYSIFMNDPSKPYYKLYQVDRSRNCIEYDNWTFLNVPMEDMKAMCVSSIKAGRMFYVSADTDREGVNIEGVYSHELYDLEALFDGVSLNMSKEELISSCEGRSIHAVAVAGVQLSDDGTPQKWLIENSFGTERGWDGFVIMTDEWLDINLFRLAIESCFVPDHLRMKFDQEPITIPAWNPVY